MRERTHFKKEFLFKKSVLFASIFILLASTSVIIFCNKNPEEPQKQVPHEKKWGIYKLDLSTSEVQLIYSSDRKISSLRLNHNGDKFAFSQRKNGNSEQDEEIFTLSVDGTDLQQLTNNDVVDIYPAWSPDDSQIAYLSRGEKDLDIYVMNAADGSQKRKLYDSGYNDADIDWVKTLITFTRNSQIWLMNDDGTNARQVTNPPRAGEWGNAPLPFGDYDPRLNPDATKIVFERLIADDSPFGNYDLFLIGTDGKEETNLTNNGYTQGLASWSHSGDRIVFLVTAIGTEGKYDIFLMNADGSNMKNITPDYFPSNFLCHSPVFSGNDQAIYFVGEWWE